MKTYSNFAPTEFDHKGAFLPGRQDWLVAPVLQTRDSECLEKSNFAAALDMLGGESKGVEVHRFGHWGPGWFEIILVNPRSRYASIAEDIERRLEDYAILDEEDLSNREREAASAAWELWGAKEWRTHHVQAFNLGRGGENCLDAADNLALGDWIDDNLSWLDEWLLGLGHMPQVNTREAMARCLRDIRRTQGRGLYGPRPTFLGFCAPNQLTLSMEG